MMKKKRIQAWIPVILWMGVIFWFSSRSGEDSGNMSGIVADVIWWIAGESFIADTLEFLVRKAAHFTEYTILGVLAYRAVNSGVKRAAVTHAGIALLICICYAASDEFHQSFVPGRSPQMTDVLIDSAGSLVGIVLYAGVWMNVIHFKADRVKKS